MYPDWRRQDPENPLFSDMRWSRPEQKAQAGNLLIVGGNVHGIAAPSQAYATAMQAGVGFAKVVMPQATKRLLPKGAHVDVEFTLSTPTGSFSQKAIDDIQAYMFWAHATLFAGDFSRNSETAIVLEKLSTTAGMQIYGKDSVDYFAEHPKTLLDRPATLLIMTFAQLQKYAKEAGLRTAYAYNMGAMRIVDALHEMNNLHVAHIVMVHEGQIYCAANGQIITTPLKINPTSWRVALSAYASVWWLQNPTKPLASLANASIDFAKSADLLD